MTNETEIQKITTGFLVQAIDDLGGSATVEQLKEYFDIEKGTQLAGARTAASRKGWIATLPDGSLALVPQTSWVGRAPNHKPNARDLNMETFIDALINLGGEATAKDFVKYFNLDTGTRLSGVRHATISQGLVKYSSGKYILVDKWSKTNASNN